MNLSKSHKSALRLKDYNTFQGLFCHLAPKMTCIFKQKDSPGAFLIVESLKYLSSFPNPFLEYPSENYVNSS
jgi:hypothetical protein